MIRNIIAHYIASNAYTIRKPIRRAEVNANCGSDVWTEPKFVRRPQGLRSTTDQLTARKSLIPSVLGIK